MTEPWSADAAADRIVEMESYDPDYLYENKFLADDLRHALAALAEARAEVMRLTRRLATERCTHQGGGLPLCWVCDPRKGLDARLLEEAPGGDT